MDRYSSLIGTEVKAFLYSNISSPIKIYKALINCYKNKVDFIADNIPENSIDRALYKIACEYSMSIAFPSKDKADIFKITYSFKNIIYPGIFRRMPAIYFNCSDIEGCTAVLRVWKSIDEYKKRTS